MPKRTVCPECKSLVLPYLDEQHLLKQHLELLVTLLGQSHSCDFDSDAADRLAGFLNDYLHRLRAIQHYFLNAELGHLSTDPLIMGELLRLKLTHQIKK